MIKARVEHPDRVFKIVGKVRVHVDFDRERVVISCETDKRKRLQLEGKYKTIYKIRDQINKQMEQL